LALDCEGLASRTRAFRVYRSLQRTSTSPQSWPPAAEWSSADRDLGGNTTDNGETSRPSRRALTRVRACGVSQIEFLYRTRCRVGDRTRRRVCRNRHRRSGSSHLGSLSGHPRVSGAPDARRDASRQKLAENGTVSWETAIPPLIPEGRVGAIACQLHDRRAVAQATRFSSAAPARS